VNILQAFLLGILQGATEFLPVSSSGHLVLVPWLLGWAAPGLAFDAVVHWGTALAVVAYFWRDWVSLVVAVVRSLRELTLRRLRPSVAAGRSPAGESAPGSSAAAQPSQGSPDARLAWLILLGTVPAAVIGWLLQDFFEGMFAWPDALLVGLAQALAIFPGISRSGATIAAGLGRGLRREPAARFSFLLATPIILGAGLFKVTDLAQAGNLAAQVPTLVAGFVTSGVVGFGCIHFLLRYLQRRRLYPFAVYCAAAGVACLLVALVRGV
jgi:undecaprenyl-diphosphatase